MQILTVRREKGLSDPQLEELVRLVNEQAKCLKGQEMIYELASFIQEHMYQHNSVIRGVKNVSFFEQMKDRQEQADKEEQERALREMEKLRLVEEEARNEEDMNLASQIMSEIQRKEAMIREEKERRKRSLAGAAEAEVALEKESSFIAPPSGPRQVKLDSISKGPRIGRGLLSFLYMVRSDDDEEHLAVKEIIISNPYYFSGDGKKKLVDIFAELETLSTVRHSNVVSIFDYKLKKLDGHWIVELLLEHCRGGSLEALVTRCGGIRLPLARIYMKQLLKALAYLHSQNIIHKDITSRNILFSGDGDDVNEVKLSDVGVARRFLDLHRSHVLDGRLNSEIVVREGWQSPELRQRPGVYGRKNDIWALGITVLEMVFGTTIYNQRDPETFLRNTKDLPPPFLALVAQMFIKDASERPTALELLKHSFFAESAKADLPVALEIFTGSPGPSPAPSRRPMPLQLTSPITPMKPTPLNSSVETSVFDGQTLSRYKIDFEELEFLGKGGFGEVVKARNRIDGRFYAIKKIKLDPKDKSNSNKILREVQTLSRLHHQFVVRYYQAWFEDATGLSWHEESDEEDYSDDDEEDFEEDSDAGSDMAASHENLHGDWLALKDNSRSIASISLSFGMAGGSEDDQETSTERDDSQEWSDGDSAGTKKSVGSSFRVLYIQMEYCEKKTLRDVIDDGVDDEEGWRLFRQVLEGLAHIHSQGMIHRDLKPSNSKYNGFLSNARYVFNLIIGFQVFLDSNGNVKIGDFGLALVREEETVARAAHLGSTGFEDMSLTTDIGTPVYVAPEIIAKGGKYSSKVDMYSLGICFFEMCYPFSTGMQRVVTLRELRTPEVVFPTDFDDKKYQSQAQIIKMLLSHVPKDRPSCQELIQSPLLPPKLEEEYISEALRSIVNQNNPIYYSRLVSSLFSQSTDRHKDITYEYNTKALNADQLTALVTTHVYAQVTKVLQRHGAIHMSAPLLIPKSDLYYSSAKRPVELLDAGGTLVQLPYDLTVPFARFLARSNTSPNNLNFTLPLKRFCIEHVYRVNAGGGQPGTVLECDFDIVTSTPGNMAPEAEVIKGVFEILEGLATRDLDPTQYEIRINHCSILDTILDVCHIEAANRRSVFHLLEQLDRLSNWSQIRNHLSLNGFSGESIEILEKFHKARGDLDAVYRAVEALFPDRYRPAAREVIGQIRLLASHVAHLGVKNKVVLMPLLSYNALYHRGGIMFQVARGGRKKLDVIASGGRYDNLLVQYRIPSGIGRKLHAVGFQFSLAKAISAMCREQAEQVNQWIVQKAEETKLSLFGSLARKSDVLVISFGKAHGLVDERMSIVADLWAAGISAEMSYVDVQSPHDAAQTALAQGYGVCVLVKQKNSEVKSAHIKVRNLITKNEVEVSRSDLIAHVQSEINEFGRPDTHPLPHVKSRGNLAGIGDIAGPSHPDISSSEMAPITGAINIIPAPWKKGKMKHKDKLQVTERAAHSITNAMGNMRKNPVFAIDLPSTAVKRLTEIDLTEDEERLRKVFEIFPSAQRE
ncbi:hypothetical protein HK097_011568 [Rhizophlyctis rosea]|uniref:non-specific serine/threonine protein kinase n=1 Tax=Rhizophlyctis rosea TaxID=64517 RepID=A0AAD5X4R8_9FUNG|nr:hypothetical protein HK097_011568 [Rhizophlyctis rosea]